MAVERIGVRAESGDFQSTPGGLEDEAHVNAEARQHINQRIRTEEVEAPSQQVAHARIYLLRIVSSPLVDQRATAIARPTG